MASYKNLSSDWYIDVDSGVGTIYINGSVDVTGNITTVSELAVDDAFIIVAANNVGTVTDMGLVAQKTLNTYAGLRFNTGANTWQVSSSVNEDGSAVAPYVSLVSGNTGTPGGNVNDIQVNDGAGGFTASNNFEFDIANNKVTLAGHQILSNIGTAPAAVANSVAIYNNAPGAGATGLYTVGTATVADEVISLTRARLYAIIF
jgi:hypothetical protein